MHKMMIVIGDDVNGQMEASGVADWWAIGGRYTGQLPLKPGRSGKTYGDAISGAEARLGALKPGDVTVHRLTHRGDGVDQARAEDVDMGRVVTVGIVRNGEVLVDMSFEVRPETVDTSMAMALGLEVSPEDADEAAGELVDWDAATRAQLAQVPGGVLLTIVDGHF